MKICVIGLGSMGKRRIRLLQLLNTKWTIIGIDSNTKRARSVAECYGIKTYSSLTDVTEEQDCAFVCTSPEFHGALINECLKRGMHVFSEINLVDQLYLENIRLAKEKNKTLFLSSTPLYRAEMQIINERIKNNGGIFAYQYHVGQYLPDWHPWDRLNEFFVSKKKTNGCRELLAIELPWIQYVFGEIKDVNVIKRKLTKLELEFPDTYLIQIMHINGSIGNLMIDLVSREAVRKLEIINENLYISWNGTPDSLYEKNVKFGKFRQIPAGEYIHEHGYGNFINEYAYAKEIEAFFKVIEGSDVIYDFEQDREILALIDEIEN